MATLGPHGFNPYDHAPMAHYDPVPAGRYLAAVVESDVRPTRAGDGQYVELRFEILGGDYRGRSVFTRLNLWNPSDAAVAMAQAELSSLCRAMGARHLVDTHELHDVPVFIDVERRSRRDNGEITNAIRRYNRSRGRRGRRQFATATNDDR